MIEDSDKLTKALDEADIYIFHVLDEDGENKLFDQTAELLALTKGRLTENKSMKTMVLVSTFMSWWNTKLRSVVIEGEVNEEVKS